MRSRLALLALLPAFALAACGDETDDAGGSDAPGSPSPTATATPPTATPLPTLTPPKAPPSTPSDSFEEATVSGTVRVDLGCTTLTDGNGVVWDLRGDLAAPLATGEQVTVTGRSVDDPDNPCPGAPLVLTRTD